MLRSRLTFATLILMLFPLLPATSHGRDWDVVVNNGDIVPGDTRTFNSYNPPSINTRRLVVFRGRSRAGMMGTGQPAHGVYTRNMAGFQFLSQVNTLFDRNTLVPYPNNLDQTFVEPPAFPRIDIRNNTIASRGAHPPTWQYMVDPESETRAGTTGIYTNPYGNLITGMSNLGEVPEFSIFSVPEYPGVKFDVFPGAPSVIGNTIVFKGNYTLDEGSRTGVYYRDLRLGSAGGTNSAVLIANSDDTLIPGTQTVFGSTAPPSGAIGRLSRRLAVFAGFDIEEAPTLGGIYLVELNGPRPPLLPLIEIGSQVPGEASGVGFNKLGEGLSFDGRFVAFWGAWGSEEKELILQCPEDGNQDRIAYCQMLYPNGFTTMVPVHQGIFVHDIIEGTTTAVAKSPTDFDDFLFWNFSGRVPGTGEGDDDGELARWRSSPFVAVSGLVDGSHFDSYFHVAFKARTGTVQAGEYVDPTDGIYLHNQRNLGGFETLVETGMDGTGFDAEAVDPEAVDPESAALPVTEMAIERDGFRGRWLAITVTMGTEEAGWAGVYLTRVNNVGFLFDFLNSFELFFEE